MKPTLKTLNDSDRWGVAALATLAIVVPIAVVLFSFLLFWVVPFGGGTEPVVVSASDGFKQLTGWDLPVEAAILKNINSHRGFKNDGDYTLILRVSSPLLRNLLDHDANKWLPCPIAADISHAAWSLPDHSGTMYYAKKTSDSDTDWHRGHIVIVNPDTGMVWICEWKV